MDIVHTHGKFLKRREPFCFFIFIGKSGHSTSVLGYDNIGISILVRVCVCVGLNENGTHRLMFEYLVLSWWNCLRRVMGCGIIRGYELVGASMEA